MRSIAMVVSVVVLVALSGCGMKSIRAYDPAKEYSFLADPSDAEIFANPPAHITRIYDFRENTIFRTAVRYNIALHTSAQAQAGFKEGMFFGFSRPGGAFVLDITPDHNPIFLSARTEDRAHFSFLPRTGHIYCMATGVVFGVFIGRPKFALVEKSLCKKFLAKYFNDKSMSQWQADRARFYGERDSRQDAKGVMNRL